MNCRKLKKADFMRKTRRIVITLTCAILAFLPAMSCRESAADSLWKRRNVGRAFLVHDSRARRKGDLLTVLINQSTQMNTQEDKALSKSTNASGAFDLDASSGGGFGISAANGNLDFGKSTDRNFSGESSYRNSRAFTDRITVTVLEVLDNGNLVISGMRNSMISGEQRTLVLTGTVRPVDIGPDNTVNSQYIADMETVYEGLGPERHFVRQGWLGRGINKIWPF